MMPINLLPGRERLWQRQRRWWRQRWTWTVGISALVWATAALVLAWQHGQWTEANAQLQALIEAQAPDRLAHQRWTQERLALQNTQQGQGQAPPATLEPWHPWQALAAAVKPPLHLERLVWNAQGITVAGHALQAADAAQVLKDWQQRWGQSGVQVVAMQSVPVSDPQGMPDSWWAFEWRWAASPANPVRVQP
jgi:Tfp pilus assembly protein PilN